MFYNTSQKIIKILNGDSKQTKGLTQEEIAYLFNKRRFGFSSGTRGYISYEGEEPTTGRIEHHGNIEVIITKQGKVIETLGDQCYRSSFMSGAKCESHNPDYVLPLATISGIYGRFGVGDNVLYDIEVLDKDGDSILFRIQDKYSSQYRYFVFGYDERQRFVADIKGQAFTVKEAYETMKPNIVKVAEQSGTEVKRQGEWFFIPTDYKDDDVQNIDTARFITTRKYERIHDYRDDTETIDSYRYINEFELLFKDLTPEQKEHARALTKKEKYTPVIEQNSNHLVQQIGTVSFIDGIGFNAKVVKGYVRHKDRDHDKIILDKWYIVVHNIVEHAYQVVSSGVGGFD